ncbi:putative signal transduction protein with CBS domains [Halorhabdus utahensis DSM 12940]|uniref:Putative signal transduction protein with CBS domains n=1 Tax=Halorhabdus utahensis (strain DSM 12940 / JCM 11049 / AX-2) TaxID=519442 RepID=C7NPS5_HALUD|nr:CBS domain-containing protein [Halorhabdus utahensis]ACV10372.1 putative signal transduction protein with CBS domains [Halorhabdus utahensis DSM 12940]
MQVTEIMSTDVVTVDRDASLRDAVGKLLTHEVGSVVVVSNEGNPVGIVTETDALNAGYRTGNPFEDIRVMDLAHRPVITTSPSATVQWVARKMADNDVKKVPVMDDLSLVGMVTLTDIVWRLSDIRAEVGDMSTAPEDWELD